MMGHPSCLGTGVKGGVQKLFSDLLPGIPVPYVHCASHNLNLVINDAVESKVDAVSFFGDVQEIYNFFGSSLNRWAELALSADMHSKLKLKKLCTTRWTSRIDAVRAIRNRYSDILKVMCQIILLSKNKKERDDACALKKKMESFEFVVFIVLWERVLNCINIKRLWSCNLRPWTYPEHHDYYPWLMEK